MPRYMTPPPEGFTRPPGTVRLLGEDGLTETYKMVLQPAPSRDPNDPLNWTLTRKWINFIPVLAITAVIFTQYSIATIMWQLWIVDLNSGFQQMNNSSAIGSVGLATGCIFLIPFAIKYGRRPVYIVSLAIMAAMAVLSALMSTVTELYIAMLITGLAGASNEAIVQMTIADIFFVHQRGTANGCYMACVVIGNFLSPIVAGAMSRNGNWRQCYWVLFAFDIAALIYFTLFYEESKYIPLLGGEPVEVAAQIGNVTNPEKNDEWKSEEASKVEADPAPLVTSQSHIDTTIPHRPWRERIRFVTKTDESIIKCIYRPFIILFTFPAIMYTAIQYSITLCWISALASTVSVVFSMPPYSFDTSGIGNMNLGPLIGCILGTIYGGVLADWSIVFFARRNHGYYEPEMRLHLAHLPAICQAGGLLMFGMTTARGMHWIYPSVGGALFGFGIGAIGDLSLSLAIDSYRRITGEAFIGIAFLRNVLGIAMFFSSVPWRQAQGIQNMFIVIAAVALVVSSLHIPLLVWGKKWRLRTMDAYNRMAESSAKQG